jgi:hypothetical protein
MAKWCGTAGESVGASAKPLVQNTWRRIDFGGFNQTDWQSIVKLCEVAGGSARWQGEIRHSSLNQFGSGHGQNQ